MITWQQAVVLAALAGLALELVRGKRAPAVVFSVVALGFLVLDFIKLDRGLAQFANPGLITVVLLMLVSVVLDKSRMLELVAGRLLRGPYRWVLAKLVVVTAAYSAFINNTAVVASLIGPLRSSSHHPPSRLLLPMCYAATVGGVLTLIGTSTNLLVNGFLLGRGLPGLHMFDLLWVGLPLFAATTVVMCLAFPALLDAVPPAPPDTEEYFVEARVRPGSKLIGRSVNENGLRHLGFLFLSEIVRGDRLIAPVHPDELIDAGDHLIFVGDVTRLDLLAGFDGLQTYSQRAGVPPDNLVEVIVAPNSALARRTLKEANFRSQFDAAVVAVRRGNERLSGPVGSLRLEVGDTLVLAVGPDFDKRNNLARNFIVVSRRSVSKFLDPRKGLLTFAAFICVVFGSAFGLFSFIKGLLVLLALFLGLGFARTADLRRNVPFGLIFIIASSLMISEVMLSSGTAALIAGGVLALVEPLGPFGALMGILVLAWLLTEVMTNNAAAALTFPIAIGMAQQLGIDYMPLVMGVIYGASASFVTPYGYHTNLMVMSPGRYSLRDFARAGSLLAIVYLSVALAAIPVFFPLR